MALKFIQTYTKLLEVTKISVIPLTNQYSGKVQIKVYHKKPTTKDEIKNFQENKTNVIDTLQDLLNIRKFTALDLLTQQKKLYTVNCNIITRNHKILKQYGVNNATIIKYPEVLALQMPANLEENLIVIKKLPYKIDDVIYLVVMDHFKLKTLVEHEGFLLRVDFLTRKLETTVDVIMVGMVKRPFLGKISIKRFEETIDLLKAHGVDNSAIIKDWWILQYSPQLIDDRIAIAKMNGIEPIKTWMVRCTQEILERCIQRRSDNKLVLGDHTLVEYLSQRLECSPDEVKSFMQKLPALQNKSMKKMKESIDFLYAEGFKPFHICRIPKILLHSVQTSKKRIRELERQGVQMDSLHMLTKSQRQYMQYYQALVKSNANKLKPIKDEKSSNDDLK